MSASVVKGCFFRGLAPRLKAEPFQSAPMDPPVTAKGRKTTSPHAVTFRQKRLTLLKQASVTIVMQAG